ncbi:hypothetical protein AB832_07940 [Flavobacteriaceae bacterium (ex Bugula neritina AB1)]|nr:hypothetical protein AB832_07940 [Flavobacteriaceae bacterium (ex Bugula neritina AB1)]
MKKGDKRSVEDLKPEHRRFCEEYAIDFNGARAYKAAYPNCKDTTARSNASKLLANTNISSYIKTLQSDLALASGVSALRLVNELKKVAFTNIGDLKKSWTEFKDFDSLTDEQKAAIAEITHSKTEFDGGEKNSYKVKTHDKLKAISMLSKMLGFDETEQNDLIKDLIFKVTQNK